MKWTWGEGARRSTKMENTWRNQHRELSKWRKTNLLGDRVAEVLEEAQGLAVERLAGPKERGLVV